MEWGSSGWDPSLTVVSNGGWRMSRACAKLLVFRWLVVSPMVLMSNHLRWFRLHTCKRKHLLPERCSKSGPSVREWVSVCYLQSSPSVEASVLGYLFKIWAWGEGGRFGIHSWVLVKRPEISWERFWRRDFLNVNPSLLPSSTVLTESEGTRCLWETRKCLVANNSFLPGIDSLVEDICRFLQAEGTIEFHAPSTWNFSFRWTRYISNSTPGSPMIAELQALMLLEFASFTQGCLAPHWRVQTPSRE